jgi:hypothetical protein
VPQPAQPLGFAHRALGQEVTTPTVKRTTSAVIRGW